MEFFQNEVVILAIIAWLSHRVRHCAIGCVGPRTASLAMLRNSPHGFPPYAHRLLHASRLSMQVHVSATSISATLCIATYKPFIVREKKNSKRQKQTTRCKGMRHRSANVKGPQGCAPRRCGMPWANLDRSRYPELRSADVRPSAPSQPSDCGAAGAHLTFELN